MIYGLGVTMRVKIILENDDFFEKTILDFNDKQILMHDADMKAIGDKNGFWLEDLFKKASKIKFVAYDDMGMRII